MVDKEQNTVALNQVWHANIGIWYLVPKSRLPGSEIGEWVDNDTLNVRACQLIMDIVKCFLMCSHRIVMLLTPLLQVTFIPGSTWIEPGITRLHARN